MKKFAISLFALCICLFSGIMLTACNTPVVTAQFSKTEIVLEMGKEYNPLDFVEELTPQSEKLIEFETEDESVAYVTDAGFLVAVDYGQTMLYITYANQHLATCSVIVPAPPIQLSSPTNLHYNENINALTFTYTLYELDGKIYPWHTYKLELKKDGGNWQSYDLAQTNTFEIKDIGSYSARIQAVSENSGFTSSVVSGAVNFNLMASPINLEYIASSNKLVWQANGNPDSTRYEVKYSVNGGQVQSIPCQTTEFVLPNALSEGKHAFQVVTVPQDDTYFKNISEIYEIEKLSAPSLTFNNGQVQWQKIDKATAYIVEVFDGETKLSEETVFASIGTYSNLPRLSCLTAGTNYSVCVTAVGDQSKNIIQSEPSLAYAFEKLGLAEVVYNNISHTFEIVNASGLSQIELVSTTAGKLVGIKQVQFTATSTLPYTLNAKLLANNSAQQIDGEVTTTFTLDQSNQTFTQIQNLSKFSGRYYEDNGQSYISYNQVDSGCEYSLSKNNTVLSITPAENVFSLGETTLLFADKSTHIFKVYAQKAPQNSTVFVPTTLTFGVTKLTSPTTLNLQNNTLSLSDVKPDGAVSAVFVVNDEQTSSLDQALSSWNISVSYLAQTSSSKVIFENQQLDMFYSSSASTAFEIKRIESPTGLSYDYTTSKLFFDKVSNANSYSVSVNNKQPQITTDNQILIEEVGVISVKSLPKTWQPITSTETGYLESLETTLTTYKVADILGLTLVKEESGALTATWTPPQATYGKDIAYSVFVKYNAEAQDFVLEQSGITQTSYTFSPDRFDEVGEYIIKVQIESPNQDFFTTETTYSLTVTRLGSPTELFRQTTTQGTILQIQGYDQTKMQGIKITETIGSNTRTFEQNHNQYAVNLEGGQTLSLKISFIGAFDQHKFNLGSLESEFNVYQIAQIKSASLKQINGFNFDFEWAPTEDADFAKNNLFYEYRQVSDNVSSTTTDNTFGSILNTTGLGFVFGVKAVAKTNWAKILPNQTVCLSNTTEFLVNVHRENKVYDVMCDLADDNVVISFKYDPVEEYTIGENAYNPEITFNYKDLTNDTKRTTYKGDLGTKITQSAYTTRQDADGFYEYVYSLSEDFGKVAEYSVSISAQSIIKTLKSEAVTLNFNRLSPVSYLKVSEETGTFVENGGASLNTTGTKQLVLTGSVTEINGASFSLNGITENTEASVTVYKQGIMDNQNLSYYFDSKPTTFRLARVASKAVMLDMVGENIYWSETLGLPDGVKYALSIKNSAELLVEQTSLSFQDSSLLLLMDKAGVYELSVKTIVPQQIVRSYKAPNGEIAYISSGFGTALEIEKLVKVENVKIANTISGIQLSWSAVSGAEGYNIYLSSQKGTKGEKVLTTNQTQVLCESQWFDQTTKILTVEAIASGKITGALSSGVEVTTLSPVEITGLTAQGVLSWNVNVSGQRLMVDSIVIEVYNTIAEKQFEVTVSPSQTTFDFGSYTNNLFIKNLEGGVFSIQMYALGTSNADYTALTLSSQSSQATAQKLFAPVIEVQNNTVVVTDTNTEIQGKKYHLSISNGTNFVFDGVYTAPVELVDLAENYTVEAYAISETEFVINSLTTTASKSRLTAPENLMLSADATQKIVTVWFDEVVGATAYEIYVDNALVSTTPVATFTFNENQFTEAGTYSVSVRAISGETLYSQMSANVNVVRLNAPTGSYVSSAGTVEIGTAVQTVSEFKIQVELFDSAFTSLNVTNSPLSALATSFDGFKTDLTNYAGGSFYVDVSYIAENAQPSENLVLSSKTTRITGFKLFAPSIKISPNKLLLTLNNDVMTGMSATADTVSELSYTITTNGDYALDENNNQIKAFTQPEFSYPTAWASGEYTVTVSAITTAPVNVISSNFVSQTTTRLESPSSLMFVRANANQADYLSDEPLEFMAETFSFKFDAVDHANGYMLNNGIKDYSASLTSQTKFDCTYSSNFEEFLYGGTNQISVIAVASVGGEYINSAPGTLSYSILSGVDYITSTGKAFTWQTPDTNFNGFLVMSIDTDSETQKFYQTAPSQTQSAFTGLIHEGINSLNIKTLGNVTTAGISENVVLDSQFIAQNQQFTKLQAVSNIGTLQGLFAFEKIQFAESYLAHLYLGEEKLLEVPLQDFTPRFNLSVAETKFVGYNDSIASLAPNKEYTLKVEAQKFDGNFLHSDLSTALTFKVLENIHTEQPLVLKATEQHLYQLDKKIITITVDPNAKGIWAIENQTISNIGFAQSLTKFDYMPNVVTSGLRTYTFATYGTTSQSQTDVHYTLSPSASLSINALEQPTIMIKDGVITWQNISGADGYYVYIDDALYGEKIFIGTSLDLPNQFSGESKRIKIQVVPVCGGDNNLWGVSRTYGITNIIEQTETRIENNYIAQKLHKPDAIKVLNGSLLYSDGLTGLNNFSLSEITSLLNLIETSQTIENVEKLEAYIENLFTNPITIYSRFTGFNPLNFDVTLTDKNNLSYTYQTSAYKFLSLTETQKQNLEDLVEYVRENIPELIEQINQPSENSLYDFISEQTFKTTAEYVTARLERIVTNFNNGNSYIESLLDVNETVRFPSQKMLFEEFEDSQTAGLEAGAYTITFKQKGNGDDWLHSSISDNQTIYVPMAPEGVGIVFNDYNYHLVWNPVEIAPEFSYLSKINGVNTNSVVYLIYGEGDNTERTLLAETQGTEYNGKLSHSLTNLVNSGVLTSKFNKLYVVVKGNATGSDNATKILSGKKSAVIDVRVLPEIQPVMKSGVLTVENVFDLGSFPQSTQIGFEITGNNFEKEVIFTNTWEGNALRSGETYTLNLRFTGIKPTVMQTNNFVISGPVFTVNLQKLLPMVVGVNGQGVFEWLTVQSSSGFVLSVNNGQSQIFNGENLTTYEAVDAGFNNFKFKALGSNCKIEKTDAVYYLNSPVNNSGYGIDGVMLSGITSTFVENGLIKWQPHQMENTSLDAVMGYKLSFSNQKTLYSTSLTSKDCFKDQLNNWCLDFTAYGEAGSYFVNIQPYLQTLQEKAVTVVNNGKTYAYLLGPAMTLDFEKIASPQNIRIENGEIVWDSSPSVQLFDYKFISSGQEITGQTTETSLWEQSLTPETVYQFAVRAYEEGKVLSSYQVFANIDNNNSPLSFSKLSFTTPTIYKKTEATGNIIEFALPQSATPMAINLKYKVEGDDAYSILKCSDDAYENIVSVTDSVVKINVSMLRDGIESMEYSLQLVPVGSSQFIASNFTETQHYVTPKPLESVWFDTETKEFFFEAQTHVPYNIKDEILDEGGNVVSTLFYQVTALGSENFVKNRIVEGQKVKTISFAPTVVGYSHRVGVAVKGEDNQLMSPYTTAENIYNANLFSANDVFASLATLGTQAEAIEFMTLNAYGTSANPYLVSSKEEFANINLRLEKYAYAQFPTILVANAGYGEFTISEPSTFVFKQTQNLTGVDAIIGITQTSSLGSVKTIGFGGVYDGNGKTLSYSLTSQSGEDVALFRVIEQTGVIKNLTVCANHKNNDARSISGVAVTNNGLIENVVIQELVIENTNITTSSLTSLSIAGVATTNKGTIKNALNVASGITLEISVNNLTVYVGGLVCYNESGASITQSGNNMNISVVARQEARVGGITAYNNADVIECYSNASITARSTNSTSFTYVGGLIGYNDSLGSVEYAYVKGSVNAQSTATNVFAGGVIGFSKNAQMQFAYSAIMQIVVQTDASGTIAKLGGTLCGYVDTKTSSGYKNYYAFTEAFGREGDESLFSSEKVDVSAYNALASLVQTINFNIGQPIFMFNGQDIVFVWENA